MVYDRELPTGRLAEWASTIAEFHLPMWDALPPLELYMDQVIVLLKQYLEPLNRSGDEKTITASIINNYVRLKVIPPPVKKKYARKHLAYLIIICILKQSLSISLIQQLLPQSTEEDAVQRLYDGFAAHFHTVSVSVAKLAHDLHGPLPLNGQNPAATAAIVSNLTKSLTEYLLQPPTE